MYLTKIAGTVGAQNPPEFSPRLAPMAAMASVAPPDDGTGPGDGDDIHHVTARQIAWLCGEILRGARPLARLRRRASRSAFTEFSRTYRLLRLQLRRDARTAVRVSRVAIGCDETTEIVVTVRSGNLVRALAMQARHSAFNEWWLTRCYLIGGY